jgi:hypothetical protein
VSGLELIRSDTNENHICLGASKASRLAEHTIPAIVSDEDTVIQPETAGHQPFIHNLAS